MENTTDENGEKSRNVGYISVGRLRMANGHGVSALLIVDFRKKAHAPRTPGPTRIVAIIFVYGSVIHGMDCAGS